VTKKAIKTSDEQEILKYNFWGLGNIVLPLTFVEIFGEEIFSGEL
jgi:hypothetical protein